MAVDQRKSAPLAAGLAILLGPIALVYPGAGGLALVGFLWEAFLGCVWFFGSEVPQFVFHPLQPYFVVRTCVALLALTHGASIVLAAVIADQANNRVAELTEEESRRAKLWIECPQCGTEHFERRQFCGGCGTALLIACVSCKSQVLVSTAFCEHCGKNPHPIDWFSVIGSTVGPIAIVVVAGLSVAYFLAAAGRQAREAERATEPIVETPGQLTASPRAIAQRSSGAKPSPRPMTAPVPLLAKTVPLPSPITPRARPKPPNRVVVDADIRQAVERVIGLSGTAPGKMLVTSVKPSGLRVWLVEGNSVGWQPILQLEERMAAAVDAAEPDIHGIVHSVRVTGYRADGDDRYSFGLEVFAPPSAP